MDDLPRLAEGTSAKGFAGIPKLLNVRIDRGWVRAALPDSVDDRQWWDPLARYYENPTSPPFLALAQCRDSDTEIVSFLKLYGTVVEDQEGVGASQLAFPTALFRFEKWQFYFVMCLTNTLTAPQNFRTVFIEHLDRARDALQKPDNSAAHHKWRRAIRGIAQVTRCSSQHDWLTLLSNLRTHLSGMSLSDLRKAAYRYVGKTIDGRLARLHLAFDFGRGRACLYANCDDLLDSFYWMLADFLARNRKLSECAHCRSVFVGESRYCPEKPECKERGRRLLDWKKNRAKYNQNRRLKRRRAAKRR